MKPLKFMAMVAMLFFVAWLSQCKQIKQESQEAASAIDSVLVNDTLKPEVLYADKTKYYEMTLTSGDIATALALPGFANLYFTVTHDKVHKPRYTRLIAYALDADNNFINDANGNPVKIPIKDRPGRWPRVIEKDVTLETGNMYLSRVYLERIAIEVPGYKNLHFIPKVSSPLSYDLETDPTSSRTTCTLQPSPPAKPGTSSCQ